MDVTGRKRIFWDIVFLLSCVVLVFLALSIYSYSSNDPSFSHIIFSDYALSVNNLFGKTGAYFSDLVGTFLGWSALFIPIFFIGTVYKLFLIRSGEEESVCSALNSFLAMLVFVFLLSVLSGFFGGNDFYFEAQHTGGISGKVSADVLASVLGKAGGIIVVSFLLVVSFMLFFALTISDIKNAIFKRTKIIKEKDNKIESVSCGFVEGEYPEADDSDDSLESYATEEILEALDDDTTETDLTEPDEDSFDTGLVIEKREDTSADYIPEKILAEPESAIDIKPKETVEQAAAVVYDVPLKLLDKASAKIKGESDESLKDKASILEQKLKDFGVLGKVREIRPGPVVTLFEFEPAPGIKINKIANLSDDLALAMSALSVRIIAPIPGKSVVGIELPNEIRESVVLSELLTSVKFAESTSPLTFAMGKDASGKPYISDLTKMPHLLIAGTTGSGKSVSVNAMICSVLYKSSPDMVKFVLIDPKMVELSIYEGIPHLAAPVVVDVRKAATVLKNVVQEMESRYTLLAEAKVRNIDSYNQKSETDGHAKMPYLVVVVDEFADLMMVAGKEVEHSIIRIAQMARAVGIHLILATQRPSVNVITGIIKANMPARLSFKVSSKIDSRTVIDCNGAELLLGRGDSLFIPPGTSETVRVHGCFVSDDEVGRITEYLKTIGEPEYNMELVREEEAESEEVEALELDDKYFEALELVRQKGFASISMIQRYLRIGYNRAARIVEIMEQKGIVSPSDGTSKPREVLKKD